MCNCSRSHEEATIEGLRKDKKYAVEYLRAVMADGDNKEISLARQRISMACPEILRDSETKASRRHAYGGGVYA